MSTKIENVSLENARIMFRNFSGRPDKFNPGGGRRSFALVLPEDLASDMSSEGWNVKKLAARDETETDTPFITVKINYSDKSSPNVYMIAGKKKTRLSEDTIGLLDQAEISNVDIEIRPYEWEISSNKGVTAYLKTLYVTIHEDRFASKYADDEEELPFM